MPVTGGSAPVLWSLFLSSFFILRRFEYKDRLALRKMARCSSSYRGFERYHDAGKVLIGVVMMYT